MKKLQTILLIITSILLIITSTLLIIVASPFMFIQYILGGKDPFSNILVAINKIIEIQDEVDDDEYVPKSMQNQLKFDFKTFFQGHDLIDSPIIPILVKDFEITDIKFRKIYDVIEMTIVLHNPGILIGKGGYVIDSLTNYLSRPNRLVKVNVEESKLWY